MKKDLCMYLGRCYMVWDCEHTEHGKVYSIMSIVLVNWYLDNGEPFSNEHIEQYLTKVEVKHGEDDPIELIEESLEFENYWKLKKF